MQKHTHRPIIIMIVDFIRVRTDTNRSEEEDMAQDLEFREQFLRKRFGCYYHRETPVNSTIQHYPLCAVLCIQLCAFDANLLYYITALPVMCSVLCIQLCAFDANLSVLALAKALPPYQSWL